MEEGEAESSSSRCISTESYPKSKISNPIYSAVLILSCVTMSSLSLIPSAQVTLRSLFRDFNATCIDLKVLVDGRCTELTGYLAVYKVSFPVVLFFSFMTGITSVYGNIHDGYWWIKLTSLITVITSSFVIPISHFHDVHGIWIRITAFGSCFYTLYILYEIVDVTNRFITTIIRIRFSIFVEIAVTGIIWILWFSLVVLLFTIHAHQDYCITKRLILVLNTGICIVLLLCSITPCSISSRRRRERLGRLPDGLEGQSRYNKNLSPLCDRYCGQLVESGVVSIFVVLWTWSAMTSSPDHAGLLEISVLMDAKDEFVCHSGVRDPMNLTFVDMSVVMIGLLSSTRSYSYYYSSSTATAYHATMTLSVMFATTQITHWYIPNVMDDHMNLNYKNWSAVGWKIGCSWLCSFVYLIYLLVPYPSCHDRQQREEETQLQENNNNNIITSHI